MNHQESVLLSFEKTTLLDQATEALRNAILNGEFQPGDRINELAFTEKSGISRPTFREALRQLEQSGILERIPYRGTFVRRFSDQDIRELNRLRSVLEVYAIQQIVEAGKNTPENMAELYRLADAMKDVSPTDDAARANELHIAFHRAIIEKAEDKTLCSTWSGLSAQFWLAMRLSQLSRFVKGPDESFAAAHRHIADTICSGNMDAVRAVMRQHVAE